MGEMIRYSSDIFKLLHRSCFSFAGILQAPFHTIYPFIYDAGIMRVSAIRIVALTRTHMSHTGVFFRCLLLPYVMIWSRRPIVRTGLGFGFVKPCSPVFNFLRKGSSSQIVEFFFEFLFKYIFLKIRFLKKRMEIYLLSILKDQICLKSNMSLQV